jgi:cell division protein ZapA
MPQVAVRIANRTYDLACGDGEEDRVLDLARYVEEKVSFLQKQIPGAPEIKLMVLAAILLADESREARTIAKAAQSASETAVDKAETLASTLEQLITARVDKMQKKVSGAA